MTLTFLTNGTTCVAVEKLHHPMGLNLVHPQDSWVKRTSDVIYIYTYIDMCVYIFTLFTYRKRRRKVICHYLGTSVLSICLWGIVYTCVCGHVLHKYVHIEVCTVHMINILDIPDIPTWVLTECDCMSVCMPAYFHTYDQRHMISPLIEG